MPSFRLRELVLNLIAFSLSLFLFSLSNAGHAPPFLSPLSLRELVTCIMAIDSGSSSGHRAPRYPGEDTTPTSKREIWGWYAYGIAAEVFAVCGVGMLCLSLLFTFAVFTSYLANDNTPCYNRIVFASDSRIVGS